MKKEMIWILALAVLVVLGWGLTQEQPVRTERSEPVKIIPATPPELPAIQEVSPPEDPAVTGEIVLSTIQNPMAAGVVLDLQELKLKVRVDGPAVPWKTRSAGVLNNLPVSVEVTNSRPEVNSLRGLEFSALNPGGGRAGLVLQTPAAMVGAGQTRQIKLNLQLPGTATTGFLSVHYQSTGGSKHYSAVIKLP